MTRRYERVEEGFVRGFRGQVLELPELPLAKEDAPCCRSRVDDRGRYPIGYCSDECVRRPKAKR